MNNKESIPKAYYPVFLNIQGQNCVVVGGGEVALRKVKILLDCGAKVTVISPTLHLELVRLVEEGAIRWIERNYEPGDFKKAMIAIAATNVKTINKKVAHDAKKRKILVNVADDPGQSDYIIPSFFRRGDLTIAISTGGGSPALAKKIRTSIEQNYGEELAQLLSLIKEVRSDLKVQAITLNPDAWQESLDLDTLVGLVRSGQLEEAKAFLWSQLKSRRKEK